MHTTTLTAFRKKPAKFFDLVNEIHEPLLVKRGNKPAFVILSQYEYHIMVESCQRFSPTTYDYTPNQARIGWEQSFKEMHANGEDQLLDPDIFENEILEDWL